MVEGKETSNLDSLYTECFFHSVARFCHGCLYNLRGIVWAVGSCSISPTADGTFQNFIFQTLRQSGKNALYFFVLLHSLLVLSSSPVSLISFPHLVFLRRRRFKRICHGGNNRAAAALSQSVCTPQAKNVVKGCVIETETSETFDHVLQTSE